MALATQPALFEKTVSNKEVVSRGAVVVLVTTDDFTGDESVCQHIIRLPKCLYEFSASFFRLFPCSFWHTILRWSATATSDKPQQSRQVGDCRIMKNIVYCSIGTKNKSVFAIKTVVFTKIP